MYVHVKDFPATVNFTFGCLYFTYNEHISIPFFLLFIVYVFIPKISQYIHGILPFLINWYFPLSYLIFIASTMCIHIYIVFKKTPSWISKWWPTCIIYTDTYIDKLFKWLCRLEDSALPLYCIINSEYKKSQGKMVDNNK